MKTISIKANEFDLNKIKELKEFYSECWNCKPDEVSTTDIIKWSIGMLHRVKVEQDFRWVSLDDFENGIWKTGFEKPESLSIHQIN